MALPDRRLTFDKRRSPTTIEHLFEEQRTGAEVNRRPHYLPWAVNVDGRQGAEAEAHADDLLARRYSIHFHVWTPDSFLDFLVAARRKFGLDFQLVGYAAAEREIDLEFILVLARAQDEVRLPPSRTLDGRALLRLRRQLAATPLGPPVRAGRRFLRPPRGQAYRSGTDRTRARGARPARRADGRGRRLIGPHGGPCARCGGARDQ